MVFVLTMRLGKKTVFAFEAQVGKPTLAFLYDSYFPISEM